jgi:hypothetical protein
MRRELARLQRACIWDNDGSPVGLRRAAGASVFKGLCRGNDVAFSFGEPQPTTKVLVIQTGVQSKSMIHQAASSIASRGSIHMKAECSWLRRTGNSSSTVGDEGGEIDKPTPIVFNSVHQRSDPPNGGPILPRPAHGAQPINHHPVQPDQPAAMLVGLVLVADRPRDSVAAIASNAAWLMAMRTIKSTWRPCRAARWPSFQFGQAAHADRRACPFG